MWVRGLKHAKTMLPGELATSHPMWVRGLKLTVAALYVVNCVVAPYAGAWIETYNESVVPFAMKSHPMRVRGLKLVRTKREPSEEGRTLCGCVD